MRWIVRFALEDVRHQLSPPLPSVILCVMADPLSLSSAFSGLTVLSRHYPVSPRTRRTLKAAIMTEGPSAPLVAALGRLGRADDTPTETGPSPDVQVCLRDIVKLLSRPRYADSVGIDRQIVRTPEMAAAAAADDGYREAVDVGGESAAGTLQARWQDRTTCDHCEGYAGGTSVTVPLCRVVGCEDAALLREAVAVCADTNAERWSDLLATLSSFVMPICALRVGMNTMRVRVVFRVVAVDPVYTFAPKGNQSGRRRRARRSQVHGSVIVVDVRQPWFAISVVVSGRSLHLFWSWLTRLGATFAVANFSVGIASEARAARSGHPYHVRLNPDSMVALLAESDGILKTSL